MVAQPSESAEQNPAVSLPPGATPHQPHPTTGMHVRQLVYGEQSTPAGGGALDEHAWMSATITLTTTNAATRLRGLVLTPRASDLIAR